MDRGASPSHALARRVVLLAVTAGFLATEPVRAYRFWSRNQFDLVASGAAMRWNDDSLPIRFRSLANERFPDILTEVLWLEGIRSGFTAWEELPTSAIRLRLEGESQSADGWPDRNGVNAIGFAENQDRPFTGAFATLVIQEGRIVECDITVSPQSWNALPEDIDEDALRARVRRLILHEVGHCLGLGHSAANPMWRVWQEAPSEWSRNGDPPQDVRTFFPNPKMAYASSYGYPGLHPDDIAGISLLYPAAGFLENTGTVRGRVVFTDGSPASFVAVSSVESEDAANPFGAHTFTDAHGQFVLEALRPGRTMLWIHPYLVPAGKAFSTADVATPDMNHTMIWPVVAAGRTLDLGEIVVIRDEGGAP